MSSILKVIEKLKLNVLNVEDVPESYSSDVYKLTLVSGENVFVKIPFNKDKLFREFQILETLQGIIPVPKVLDIWYGDESTAGALLLSAIQGVPCTGHMDEKLSYQIGVHLAMLHEVKTSGYGYYMTDGFQLVDQNDWRLYIQNNFEKWKEPCKEILDSALYERCILRFAELFATLPDPDGPCMVHMDFRPGNILVNGNEVAGIIDFESARGGSSEVDFTKLHRYIWAVHPRTKVASLRPSQGMALAYCSMRYFAREKCKRHLVSTTIIVEVIKFETIEACSIFTHGKAAEIFGHGHRLAA